ncbi:MAG: hypothetical protein IJ060_09840 [Oscillospiraceae bacterium]|nr:hypothetical protein [Oscillospiraceae bacterium]
MLCCRCRRESPPGKFCAVCGGLLNAVPLSGKMPEPYQAQPAAPPPAQPPAEKKAKHTAMFLAASAVLLAILVLAVLLILR